MATAPADASNTNPGNTRPSARISSIDLMPVSEETATQIELVDPPLKKTILALESSTSDHLKFLLPLKLHVPGARAALLIGKESAIAKNEYVQMKVPLTVGANSVLFSAINANGDVSEYRLQVQLDAVTRFDGVDSAESLLVGAFFYSRTLHREGSAVGGISNGTALVPGLHAQYRRQFLSDLTSRLPLNVKLTFEGNGAIGKTMSGSPLAQGTPVWTDLMFNLSVVNSADIALEGGVGGHLFLPAMTLAQPGDVDTYLGFAVTGRATYFFSKRYSLQLGALVALPNADKTGGNVIESYPLDSWLAFRFTLGKDSIWEIRARYYFLHTSGSIVDSGHFTRRETFSGLEAFWIRRF